MKRSRKRKLRKLKRDRITLITISFSILLIVIVLSINLLGANSTFKNESVVKNYNESIDITLSAVGDIMVHNDQLKAQYNESIDSYSFENNFKYISPYIKDSDLALANLETTFTGKNAGYSSFPRFNSPDSLSNALEISGFDIVSTSNNHTYDRGSNGLYRTLDVLKDTDLESIGTRKSSNENNFLIKDVDGIKMGITAFTYGDNFKGKTYLNGLSVSSNDVDNINVFDFRNVDNAFNTIKATLDNMNTNKTDLKVLMLHWGNEYDRQPSNFQRELAQKLCDYGVDIIIGSHPHVVQPIEIIQSNEGNNETLVVYSLGNFLSNQRNEILKKNYTEDGLIVNIDISKNLETNETKISKVEYIPTWVNKFKDSSGELNYEIIPIIDESNILSIPNLPYDDIETSYTNTTSIIDSTDILNVKTN